MGLSSPKHSEASDDKSSGWPAAKHACVALQIRKSPLVGIRLKRQERDLDPLLLLVMKMRMRMRMRMRSEESADIMLSL